MPHTTRPISPLRQRMIEDMALRKLAPKTRSKYLRAVIKFTCFLGRSPDTASPEDLRRYQLHLVETGISRISLNHTITALRFFFGVTLDHAEVMARMSSVREPRKLPVMREIFMRTPLNRIVVIQPDIIFLLADRLSCCSALAGLDFCGSK